MFAQVFVTLLVVMDPVGNVPTFLALTRAHDDAQRRRAALHAAAAAAGIIFTSAAVGNQVLLALGISLEALQVSGGLLLLLVALELLQGGRSGDQAVESGINVALVPLGTPLLAGPGAIASTIVFTREADSTTELAGVVAALVAVLVVVYVALRAAAVIARRLGANGIVLLSRVVGLLVAAIAVQMVATGVEGWVTDGVAR